MSKHRNHIDRRRNLIGNALGQQRLKELEKYNKVSPVFTVSSSTGQKFEVYNPNMNKGRRSKSIEQFS